MDFATLRQTLFVARKLFYGVVRHAVGVEIDDEERARLHAYLAGELVGRERRLARRHVTHCSACQALVREQRVFTQGAQQILAPLPFVAGAQALARPTLVKGGAVAAGPAMGGTGLLGQAGAAKALAATIALMGTGVGVNAWLSITDDDEHAHIGAIRPLNGTSRFAARLISSATPAKQGQRSATPGSSRAQNTRPRHAHQRSHRSTPRASSLPPTVTGASGTRLPIGSTARPASAGSGSSRNEFSFEAP
jgi:hypothetical protein